MSTPSTAPRSTTPLQPTLRTRVTRGKDRAVTDRSALLDFLNEAMVGHLGVWVDDHPVVIPTAFAVDPQGPDRDGTLYVHGSVAAGWLRAAAGAVVCVTVTELDGLVAARSAFHHSVNYRSAVIIGEARLVTDEAERDRALALIVDQLIPDRAATLRPHTRQELAATAVLAVPLFEASMKCRAEGAHDDPDDVAAGVWAGVIPLRRVADAPITNDDADGDPPAEILACARALGADV